MAKEIEFRAVQTHFDFLLNNTDRYVFSFGGSGSGKSYSVAQALLLRILTEKNRGILLIRKNLKHVRESQFKLLKDLISLYNLEKYFKVFESTMKIVATPTKSEFLAFGMDNSEKIKSIAGITDAWLEEATELSESDFNQIDARIREASASFNQIISTFNPIDKRHWIKKRFFDGYDIQFNLPTRYKLESKIADGSTAENRVSILKTNYLCNIKNLPVEYVANLEHMKKVDPVFYQVYVNAEWGNYKEGLVFKRDYYREWSEIPADARGVIYCDPNLGIKQEGDTTAIVKLLYSHSTDNYYVAACSCRAMTDPNELISKLFSMRSDNSRVIGFDGNFSQESHWSAHIQSYRSKHGLPPVAIDYKRYKIDQLAKSAQILWNEGKIFFPPGFGNTADGTEALPQIFTFAGKKNTKVGMKDDAPDALIGAIELLIDNKFASVGSNYQIINSISKKG